jgi:hypothetical protein
MTNYQRTAEWLKACGKTPGNEGDASVQIGCMIEEIAEFLHCLRSPTDGYALLLDRVVTDLEWFSGKLKTSQHMVYIPRHKREDALDAICDIEVTGNGVAYLSRFDKDGADQAVLASNDAKLVDGKPVLLPGGKIGKPAGWLAPDLSKFSKGTGDEVL